MRYAIVLLAALALIPGAPAQPAAGDDAMFAALRDAYLAKYKPLFLDQSAAWWEANITGDDAAFARKAAVDKAIVDLHSDRDTFAKLQALKERGALRDPVAARELSLMYRKFLAAQADPQVLKRIVELENDVEQAFNTFRARVGERALSENEVRAILASSTDSAAVEAAWKGYMAVGQQVEGRLRELVQLRNEVARGLGFRDYCAFNLTLQEIDEQELRRLFDELDVLTRAPFTALKAEIDAARAQRFGVAPANLRPWHYGDLFFQEAPSVTPELDFDALFKDTDLVAAAKTYFASLGLPVDDILARSSLYEQPGKCPHAFCHDMDRAGDVRVLCNMQPNVYWANTILHELGHAVYARYPAETVPFLLRDAPHALTTEGVAELFGALCKNEEWLVQVLGIDARRAAEVGRVTRASLRTERLMFARWAQVMVRFEQGLYGNPEQDLGQLWWDLKRQYQLLNPPETTARPNYAAKVHVLTTPVYYHSYLMGELFAAQVRHALARDVLQNTAAATKASYFGQPAVGTWLRERIFAPGDTLAWEELTRRATGEPLTAKYFAAELAP